MSLVLARDVLALTTTFLLAGGLLAYAIFPEPLGAGRRLQLALALSVPATVAVSIPAVAAGALSLWTTVVALALLASVALFRTRERVRRLPTTISRATLPRAKPPLRMALVAVAAGILAWVLVLDPQLDARRPDAQPLHSTSWYYWWLADEVANDGGIPASLPEWGSDRPFQRAYVATTLHTAATMQIGGGADFALQERYGITLIVLALIAFLALWNRWLPAWWAVTASLLSLTTAKGFYKFLAYRPEIFGLVLVLWSAWLLDEALERRSRAWGLLAGLVASVGYLAHAEIWILTGPLWAAIALARLLVPSWRNRPASQPGAKRSLRRRFVGPLVPLLLALPVCFTTIFAVQAATAPRDEILTLPGVASDWDPRGPGGVDLTWQLYASVWTARSIDDPPRLPCHNALFGGPADRLWAHFAISDPLPRLAPVIFLAGVAVSPYAFAVAGGRKAGRASRWARLPRRSLLAALVGAIFVVGVLAFVVFACQLYDTYVPQRAWMLRVRPYYALGLAGLLALVGYAGAKGAFFLMSGSTSARLRHRTVPRVAAGVATAAASVAILSPFVATEVETGIQHRGLSPGAYSAYLWLRDNTPPDSVILANAYTDGQIGPIAGRAGWLDGRIPFLEASPWLRESVERVVAAREYFRQPENGSLPSEVDYVLVASRRTFLGGPRPPFPSDRDAFMNDEDLHLEASFSNGRVLIFSVAGR